MERIISIFYFKESFRLLLTAWRFPNSILALSSSCGDARSPADVSGLCR